MPVSIDSNQTSGFFNEETALNVAGPGPWYPIEPNTYSDFGGDYKTVAREFITATRQRAKGTVTDMDVTAGWNEDYTQNNITRILQGFFFANAREKPCTASLVGYAVQPISVIAGAPGSFHTTGTSFITLGFKVGHIIQSAKFLNAGNNFVWVISAVTATDLTCSPVDTLESYTQASIPQTETSTLITEAASVGTIEAVGFQMPSTSTLTGLNGTSPLQMNNATVNFTTFGFVVGEWIFIGDNNGINAPSYNFYDSATPTLFYRGWARISAITANQLTFDVTLLENYGSGSNLANATGDGGTRAYANIYFGKVIMNEPNPANIIRRTYSVIRTLGNDINNAPIYEIVTGAIPNQFTLNVPSNNKLVADMTFVPMNTDQLAGTPSGTFNTPLNEDPYNTSQDMFALLLYVINTTNPEQVPLFGYASDEKLVLNNNVKVNKAIGVVGGFEGNTGSLDVSGTLTCYFDDERSISAIRNNDDVGLLNIFAKQRSGMIFDLPLLTLGGGKLKVEKDKPITADITHTAAAGTGGYTILHNKFNFLPDAAMPDYSPVVFTSVQA